MLISIYIKVIYYFLNVYVALNVINILGVGGGGGWIIIYLFLFLFYFIF